jgi:hypothetical protein
MYTQQADTHQARLDLKYVPFVRQPGFQCFLVMGELGVQRPQFGFAMLHLGNGSGDARRRAKRGHQELRPDAEYSTD